MKLPAGIVDRDFEFFLHQGKLMVIHDGKIKSFDSMPASLVAHLEELLSGNDDANLCLDCMDLMEPHERLRQFVMCRFSSFDLVADIMENGNMSPEFTLCEKRGRCPYEGMLCVSLKKMYGISSRELQVIRMIAMDIPVKLIADNLDISINTVSTHIQNIRTKLGEYTMRGVMRWAFEHDLINAVPESPEMEILHINH